jgi:hypothetical protein
MPCGAICCELGRLLSPGGAFGFGASRAALCRSGALSPSSTGLPAGAAAESPTCWSCAPDGCLCHTASSGPARWPLGSVGVALPQSTRCSSLATCTAQPHPCTSERRYAAMMAIIWQCLCANMPANPAEHPAAHYLVATAGAARCSSTAACPACTAHLPPSRPLDPRLAAQARHSQQWQPPHWRQ